MDNFKKIIKGVLKDDQLDRKNLRAGILSFKELIKKDQRRRNKTSEIIKKSEKKFSRHDYFNAAIPFLHSNKIGDLNMAERLAKKSLVLGNKKAKRLLETIEDRKLITKRKKQKYGTQIPSLIDFD